MYLDNPPFYLHQLLMIYITFKIPLTCSKYQTTCLLKKIEYLLYFTFIVFQIQGIQRLNEVFMIIFRSDLKQILNDPFVYETE